MSGAPGPAEGGEDVQAAVVPARPRRGNAGRLPVPVLSSSSAVERRRALPIHAYIGANGHFKTATMVRDSLPSLAAGRPVLSTVEILGPDGAPHPLYTKFEHWDQLRDFTFGDLLLDEIVGIANSRESGLPPDIQNILMQLRRRDVLMRLTAPDYARADKIIREACQGISVCKGYLPDRRGFKARADEEGRSTAVRAWAPNRLASVLTYDGKDMGSAFNQAESARKRLRPKIREWYWAPASGVFDAYDTMGAVSVVTYLCPVCGGKPVSKTCRGHDDDDHAPPRRARGHAHAVAPTF